MSKPRRNKESTVKATVPPRDKYQRRYLLEVEVDRDTFMFFKDYHLDMYNYKVDVSSTSYPMFQFGQPGRSWVKGDFATILTLEARMTQKK